MLVFCHSCECVIFPFLSLANYLLIIQLAHQNIDFHDFLKMRMHSFFDKELLVSFIPIFMSNNRTIGVTRSSKNR